MKTRIIHTAIHYEDDWFATLSIGYRYLFIYLFTNSHIGQTGAYKLTERIILLETGATAEEWKSAKEKFEKDKKVLYIEEHVVVLNAKRHSDYSGGKNETAYKREFSLLPKAVQDTLSIHYQYPIDTTINHNSEIRNQKPETRNPREGKGFQSAKEIADRLRVGKNGDDQKK